jgi:hypothetical protein
MSDLVSAKYLLYVYCPLFHLCETWLSTIFIYELSFVSQQLIARQEFPVLPALRFIGAI